MTTISTDGAIMAADSRTSGRGSILTDKAQKLHRLPDGSVVGGAGDTDFLPVAIGELARSIEAADSPAPTKGDYSLLRLLHDGTLLYYYEKLLPIEISAPFAIGSGADYAIGAMLAGASAVRAVEVAKKIDTGTGGRIRTLEPRR